MMKELKRVHEELQYELIYFRDVSISQKEKNDRLTYLYVKDMLDHLDGKILNMKVMRETELNGTNKSKSIIIKIIGWIIYLLLTSGMLFYVYLFAVQQSKSTQYSWVLTFCMWIVFDIACVCPGVVYLIHIYLPSLTIKNLNQVKSKVSEYLQTLNISREATSVFLTKSEYFNAAKYFYVSNMLSRQFVDLPASHFIQRYTTYWPKLEKQPSNDSKSNKFSRYFIVTSGKFCFK